MAGVAGRSEAEGLERIKTLPEARFQGLRRSGPGAAKRSRGGDEGASPAIDITAPEKPE